MADVRKLCVGGNGGRRQGGLRYGATLQEVGSRGQGVGSRGAAPVSAARPGGGLGVSPR